MFRSSTEGTPQGRDSAPADTRAVGPDAEPGDQKGGADLVQDGVRKAAQDRELADLGRQRREGYQAQEKLFFEKHLDNDQDYAGFEPAWDEAAFEALGLATASCGPNDILIMPDPTGMGYGNSAITLLTEDKVIQFKQIVLSRHGPDARQHVCYRKLLDRIRIGTILVSQGLMSDSMRFRGTIWHEAGHKVLDIATESGSVFVFEITMIKKHYGAQAAYQWSMKNPRTPGYHRTYGLLLAPGREELLAQLQDLVPEAEFHREFAAEHERLTGRPLPVTEAVATALERERLAAAERAKNEVVPRIQPVADPVVAALGTEIEGTLVELRAMLPPKDLLQGRKDMAPARPEVDGTVTFARKKWTVLSVGRNEGGLTTWRLKCVSLTE
jgi:hypothetical protein